MELILMQDVRDLGRRGDVVRVKPGYARNFLIPQGFGLPATRANVQYFEEQKSKLDEVHSQERDAALVVAGELANVKISISKRSIDGESLYGSVMAAEISQALAEQGVEIDTRDIDLEGGIKTVGEHPVRVDLHSDVVAELSVTVVAEE